MDSDTAVVAREKYHPKEGRTDAWAYAMPSLGGEIVIRTVSANWYVGVTDEGNLEVRAVNLPAGPAVRIVVKADSSNFLTLESRDLGS